MREQETPKTFHHDKLYVLLPLVALQTYNKRLTGCRHLRTQRLVLYWAPRVTLVTSTIHPVEDNMIARVTRVRMKPDHVDDAIRMTNSEIVPNIENDPGLGAFYVLGDRRTGDTLVVTLWETEEQEQESRQKVAQRFGMIGEYLASQPEPSQMFEVMNSFVPSRAPMA